MSVYEAIKLMNSHRLIFRVFVFIIYNIPLYLTARRSIYSTCQAKDDATTNYRQEQVKYRSCDIVLFQPHPLFCSEPYQRIAWEALKKNINGLVNKVAMVTPVYPPCDVVMVPG